MSCEPRPAGGLRLAVCGVCGGDMGGDRCVCGAHVLVGRQRTRLPAPRDAHGVVRWSGGANGRIQIPRVHAVLVSRVGKRHRAHDDASLLSLEVLHAGGASHLTTPRAMRGQRQADRPRTGSVHAASTRHPVSARGQAQPGTAGGWRRALCGTQSTQDVRRCGDAGNRPNHARGRSPSSSHLPKDAPSPETASARARAHGRAELPYRRSPSAWLDASLSRGVAASEARPRGQCEPSSSPGRMRHAELIGYPTLAVGNRVARTRRRRLFCMSPARRPTWSADGSELGHD
jgi:hypothetical protein